MLMNKFTLTKKTLIGILVICIVAISGVTLWLSTRPLAQAAIINPHPGLVGWWRFDEGTGTIAGDSSGYGNNGTIYGATWTTGKYGDALSFNGISNYVVTNAFSLTGTQLTFSAWVNLNSVSGSQELMGSGTYGSDGYIHIYASGSDLGVGYYSSGYRQLTWYGFFTAGSWINLAVVEDYTALTITVYKNGALVSFQNMVPGATFPATSQFRVLGAYSSAGPNWYGGLMDEVHLYNTALSAAEIQTGYQENPDFSSKLLAKVPKSTTQVMTTLSWQGTGSINVTISSPSQTFTEANMSAYQKTTYSTSGGTSSMLNIKRVSVTVNALSADQDWYITLTYDAVSAYQISVEVQK